MRSARGPRHGPRGLLAYAGAMTYTLVLLRHGESEWNQKNLFTGWVDVPLTGKGRSEGVRAGELLREHDLLPDVLHTSLLKRAILTAQITLETADRSWIETVRSWRLNERHYGALQGKDKKEIRDEYGEEQFMQWRRSFDTPPPPLDDASEWSQVNEARYANLGAALPRTECLADVIVRMLPYWYDAIVAPPQRRRRARGAARRHAVRPLIDHREHIPRGAISG